MPNTLLKLRLQQQTGHRALPLGTDILATSKLCDPVVSFFAALFSL